jgi:hypothetical protein
MFVIAIPVYFLFELSLLLSRLVVRAKAKRAAKSDDDEKMPPRQLPPGAGGGREPQRLGGPA